MDKVFNLSENHFLSLCKQKIPLDCIFLLELIDNQGDVNSEEYLPFLQRLQRKGYIDNTGGMTEYGKQLYKSLFEEVVAIKAKKPIEKNDAFERWWSIYPSTNDFEINGKHFQGTQKKNLGKEECKKLFNVLCNSYTSEDIILATSYHINMAKEVSYKKRDNQLTYIPNSIRYLREKYFEGYIEKAKKKNMEAKIVKDFEI